MIESHITASDEGTTEVSLSEGYTAASQTKTCFVFQLNKEVRSAQVQSCRYRSLDLRGNDGPASRSNFN